MDSSGKMESIAASNPKSRAEERLEAFLLEGFTFASLSKFDLMSRSSEPMA